MKHLGRFVYGLVGPTAIFDSAIKKCQGEDVVISLDQVAPRESNDAACSPPRRLDLYSTQRQATHGDKVARATWALGTKHGPTAFQKIGAHKQLTYCADRAARNGAFPRLRSGIIGAVEGRLAALLRTPALGFRPWRKECATVPAGYNIHVGSSWLGSGHAPGSDTYAGVFPISKLDYTIRTLGVLLSVFLALWGFVLLVAAWDTPFVYLIHCRLLERILEAFGVRW